MDGVGFDGQTWLAHRRRRPVKVASRLIVAARHDARSVIFCGTTIEVHSLLIGATENLKFITNAVSICIRYTRPVAVEARVGVGAAAIFFSCCCVEVASCGIRAARGFECITNAVSVGVSEAVAIAIVAFCWEFAADAGFRAVTSRAERQQLANFC